MFNRHLLLWGARTKIRASLPSPGQGEPKCDNPTCHCHLTQVNTWPFLKQRRRRFECKFILIRSLRVMKPMIYCSSSGKRSVTGRKAILLLTVWNVSHNLMIRRTTFSWKFSSKAEEKKRISRSPLVEAFLSSTQKLSFNLLGAFRFPTSHLNLTLGT